MTSYLFYVCDLPGDFNACFAAVKRSYWDAHHRLPDGEDEELLEVLGGLGFTDAEENIYGQGFRMDEEFKDIKTPTEVTDILLKNGFEQDEEFSEKMAKWFVL